MQTADAHPAHRLNIVADAHIWGVESAFSSLPGIDVSLHVMEASEINRHALLHADALITRSGTKVNAQLLAGTPVRFAATATIGDDHFDKVWLDEQAIVHANAAGSSTGSVIEYMLTTLLELHARGLIDLPATRIGIIGAGRIGGRLAGICDSLNIPVLCNDPPRARKEGNDGFSTLHELLETADVLSLHTPLHRTGEDCTMHLIGAAELARFKGRGIINAGRGACLDNAALLDWLNADASRFAVLDCWEGEPGISPALLAHPQLALATPHIAGHSVDGKAANTLYARQALCRWLGVPDGWDMHGLLPDAGFPVSMPCSTDIWANLHAAATAMYDIAGDDAALRGGLDPDDPDIARRFTSLRRHYPPRRSWEMVALNFRRPDPMTPKLARAMGMKIV